ncbi:MAG TPA: Type 1 glutamine amidotransferase-like domain-containing protein [Candidatus Enterousia avicola]|uniref:Type 1 glutamine amidotransferase-like domain-containing protein n=1 Tax=Candidatus Enterousia avicola TaxID=2840787 RepID=A0A9D1MRM6_9PROT|nr:Type 1 glutamine amidotransferase-like domain-containing protein [Candidatus Enterousia avicola]
MKIVAIGGGENGRTKILPDGTIKQYPFENTLINKKIIELSGKKNPNILILGTAGNDLPSYTDFLITHFQSLGANVSELRLINNPPTIDNIRKILDNTDIIYVGGGDTLLISYIQPFEDGNKRTARTVGNALLLAADYCPLSYRNADEIEYKKGMILFYEQNDWSYFKTIFTDQFRQGIEKYF